MSNNHKPKTDRRRARPTPSWLTERKDLDEIAQRRCLMVLSVLSGETPVSDAIEQAQVSRGTYYQLEERALRAMLVALTPGSGEAPSESPAHRIAELEQKIVRLEREKRRGERLLLLTRKVVKDGPLKVGAGRPPKRLRSTTPGPKPSRVSKPKATVAPPKPSTPSNGEAAP